MQRLCLITIQTFHTLQHTIWFSQPAFRLSLLPFFSNFSPSLLSCNFFADLWWLQFLEQWNRPNISAIYVAIHQQTGTNILRRDQMGLVHFQQRICEILLCFEIIDGEKRFSEELQYHGNWRAECSAGSWAQWWHERRISGDGFIQIIVMFCSEKHINSPYTVLSWGKNGREVHFFICLIKNNISKKELCACDDAWFVMGFFFLVYSSLDRSTSTSIPFRKNNLTTVSSAAYFQVPEAAGFNNTYTPVVLPSRE